MSDGQWAGRMESIREAENNLTGQLNYGGLIRDSATRRLVLDYKQGDLVDEIGQMRRLAQAFLALADALDDPGIECSVQMPAAEDADENGFVEWLRSGVWLRGLVSGNRPVDATHWRPLPSKR